MSTSIRLMNRNFNHTWKNGSIIQNLIFIINSTLLFENKNRKKNKTKLNKFKIQLFLKIKIRKQINK